MTEDTKTTGGCHCGAIQYTLSVPGKFAFLCHCDNCRKLNGGSRLSAVGFPKDALAVTGTPTTYTYAGGKDDITAHFCGTCGTPLYAEPKAHPAIVIMRMNSLDDQNAFPPKKSTYEELACVWDKTL